MEIQVIRKRFTEKATISELMINDQFTCFILEDTDRGLNSTMPLSKIKAIKIRKETAIPVGRYEVVISFSNRFQKLLPLLTNVPGFDGIRIHPGNTAANTDGCLLPGLTAGPDPDIVGQSRLAFTKLFTIIMGAVKKEKVFISITRDEDTFQAFLAKKKKVAPAVPA